MRNKLIETIRQRVENAIGKQSYMTIKAHHTHEDIFLIELVSGMYQLKGTHLVKVKKPTGVFINEY